MKEVEIDQMYFRMFSIFSIITFSIIIFSIIIFSIIIFSIIIFVVLMELDKDSFVLLYLKNCIKL